MNINNDYLEKYSYLNYVSFVHCFYGRCYPHNNKYENIPISKNSLDRQYLIMPESGVDTFEDSTLTKFRNGDRAPSKLLNVYREKGAYQKVIGFFEKKLIPKISIEYRRLIVDDLRNLISKDSTIDEDSKKILIGLANDARYTMYGLSRGGRFSKFIAAACIFAFTRESLSDCIDSKTLAIATRHFDVDIKRMQQYEDWYYMPAPIYLDSDEHFTKIFKENYRSLFNPTPKNKRHDQILTLETCESEKGEQINASAAYELASGEIGEHFHYALEYYRHAIKLLKCAEGRQAQEKGENIILQDLEYFFYRTGEFEYMITGVDYEHYSALQKIAFHKRMEYRGDVSESYISNQDK